MTFKVKNKKVKEKKFFVVGDKVLVTDYQGNLLTGKIINENSNGTYNIKTKNKIINYVAPISFTKLK